MHVASLVASIDKMLNAWFCGCIDDRVIIGHWFASQYEDGYTYLFCCSETIVRASVTYDAFLLPLHPLIPPNPHLPPRAAPSTRCQRRW